MNKWTCPACGHGMVPISRRRWRNWFRKTVWRMCVACDWQEQVSGPASRSKVNN